MFRHGPEQLASWALDTQPVNSLAPRPTNNRAQSVDGASQSSSGSANDPTPTAPALATWNFVRPFILRAESSSGIEALVHAVMAKRGRRSMSIAAEGMDRVWLIEQLNRANASAQVAVVDARGSKFAAECALRHADVHGTSLVLVCDRPTEPSVAPQSRV